MHKAVPAQHRPPFTAASRVRFKRRASRGRTAFTIFLIFPRGYGLVLTARYGGIMSNREALGLGEENFQKFHFVAQYKQNQTFSKLLAIGLKI